MVILGVGLDLVEIERFELPPERLARLAARVFTEAEAAYAAGRRRPAQHLAARFAAKEAFRKALGEGVPWREVGVARAAGGPPTLALSEAVRARLARRGVRRWHVTLTHGRAHAAATVILEGDGAEEARG